MVRFHTGANDFTKGKSGTVIRFGERNNHLTNGPKKGFKLYSTRNDDDEVDIIAVTDMGDIGAFSLDGTPYHHFPITNNYPFKSAPLIIDLDGDNDLEIISGSGGDLVVIDVKEIGSTQDYWHIFRRNNQRNGYYILEGETECAVSLGDVNGDASINILDLVQISNYILELSTLQFPCAADFNQDEIVNILDLVQIANFILDN